MLNEFQYHRERSCSRLSPDHLEGLISLQYDLSMPIDLPIFSLFGHRNAVVMLCDMKL